MLDYLIKQTETVMNAKVGEFPNYIAKLMLARELAYHFERPLAWKIAVTVQMNVSRAIVSDPEFKTLIKNIGQIIVNVNNQLLQDTQLKGEEFTDILLQFLSTMQFHGE